MSFSERPNNNSNRDERDWGEITDLQKSILTKAQQWKIEGTPWWTPQLMRRSLEGRQKPLETYEAMMNMDIRGLIEAIRSERVEDDGPFIEIPTDPLNVADSNSIFYCRITETGEQAIEIIS